ncbi:helix-turn-helix domain-containing protein [Legionella sp. 29fVS95]|uniref:helix-turn-helix domain-containing protein n=1 Tax=Legionella sp. 29fVS95 TaxID=3402813 RepID=UPI003AF41501
MAKQIKKLQTPNLQSSLTAQLLGDAIKARRTQSNLKLEDAAALCGIAKETFMKIEHGQSNCQLASVLKICSGLGVNLYIKPWVENGGDKNDWS